MLFELQNAFALRFCFISIFFLQIFMHKFWTWAKVFTFKRDDKECKLFHEPPPKIITNSVSLHSYFFFSYSFSFIRFLSLPYSFVKWRRRNMKAQLDPFINVVKEVCLMAFCTKVYGRPWQSMSLMFTGSKSRVNCTKSIINHRIKTFLFWYTINHSYVFVALHFSLLFHLALVSSSFFQHFSNSLLQMPYFFFFFLPFICHFYLALEILLSGRLSCHTQNKFNTLSFSTSCFSWMPVSMGFFRCKWMPVEHSKRSEEKLSSALLYCYVYISKSMGNKKKIYIRTVIESSTRTQA